MGEGSPDATKESSMLEGRSLDDLDQETKEILGRYLTNVFWVSTNQWWGVWPNLAVSDRRDSEAGFGW